MFFASARAEVPTIWGPSWGNLAHLRLEPSWAEVGAQLAGQTDRSVHSYLSLSAKLPRLGAFGAGGFHGQVPFHGCEKKACKVSISWALFVAKSGQECARYVAVCRNTCQYTCQSVSKREGLDIVEGATCVTRSICSKQHRDPISELTTIGNSKKRIASGSQRGVC